jgi:hypothetical protein
MEVVHRKFGWPRWPDANADRRPNCLLVLQIGHVLGTVVSSVRYAVQQAFHGYICVLPVLPEQRRLL